MRLFRNSQGSVHFKRYNKDFLSQEQYNGQKNRYTERHLGDLSRMWKSSRSDPWQKAEAFLFAGVSAEMVERSPASAWTESGL